MPRSRHSDPASGPARAPATSALPAHHPLQELFNNRSVERSGRDRLLPQAPPRPTLDTVLSLDELARYHRDGFLAIADFATPAARTALKRRANEIVAAFEPTEHRTIFTTNEQERVSNREFLDSGAGIWCFFEADAFGPDGRLAHDKSLSINKIGHAMHDLDPVFEAFSYTRELAEVAHDVGLHDPLAVQSMYIFKQPLIGGEVNCHQDAPFLYTDPITVTGFWFAIEDATLENGCLWVQPGGHRGPLRRLYQRADDLGEAPPASSSSTTPRCRRRRRTSCRSSRRPGR